MVDPESVAKTYRDKAERCRRLARQTTDREIAQHLLDMAREFEQQAAQAAENEG